MADISKEIEAFSNAVEGKNVRGSMISLAEKVNAEVEENTIHVDGAVNTANGASQTANQAAAEAQRAIIQANDTLGAANVAKESAQESATAASNSAAAAAGSEGQAGTSAAAAAASAATAQQIADGFGNFDGTAASVAAVDVQGIVGDAGGNSNVQALISAVADQVINRLIGKNQIVNNLLATAPGNVLDATQGKALKDDVTKLYSDLDELNNNYGSGLGVIMKTGDDLDIYIAPGRYYSNSAAISGSLIHCPYTSGGFTLDVGYNASQAYLWQEIRTRGNGAICYRTRSDGTWNDWKTIITNADIITKTITLTPITIAANSGTSGTSLDISDQIPAGYKLLDIRERSTGNNNCYVYYFNCIGTTVSYQIRNVSASSITTTPTATAVLMKS